MLFKSGLGQKQGVGGWGRGGYVEWVGGGGGKGWVGGWGVGGGGGLPPLPTHPPLRFTREQTRVEYIRRCRLISLLSKICGHITTESIFTETLSLLTSFSISLS